MNKKQMLAFGTLFLISLVYDRMVIRRGGRQGWLEPFTALTVVAGVLYTLIGGSSATIVLTLHEAPLFAVSQTSRDHTSDA